MPQQQKKRLTLSTRSYTKQPKSIYETNIPCNAEWWCLWMLKSFHSAILFFLFDCNNFHSSTPQYDLCDCVLLLVSRNNAHHITNIFQEGILRCSCVVCKEIFRWKIIRKDYKCMNTKWWNMWKFYENNERIYAGKDIAYIQPKKTLLQFSSNKIISKIFSTKTRSHCFSLTIPWSIPIAGWL